MTSPKPLLIATRVWALLQSRAVGRERCGATLQSFIQPIRARDPRANTATTWQRGAEENGGNRRTRGGTKVGTEHSFLEKFVNCPGLFLQSFNWINTPFTDVATKQLTCFPNYYTWETCCFTLIRLFFLVCRTCGPLCIISAVLSITFSWTLQHSAALFVALPHRVNILVFCMFFNNAQKLFRFLFVS